MCFTSALYYERKHIQVHVLTNTNIATKQRMKTLRFKNECWILSKNASSNVGLLTHTKNVKDAATKKVLLSGLSLKAE